MQDAIGSACNDYIGDDDIGEGDCDGNHNSRDGDGNGDHTNDRSDDCWNPGRQIYKG